MKASEAEIIIIPGHANSGPEHWQSRWEARLSTARRVEQADWHNPELDAWKANIVEAVNSATKPVILIAHGLGVPALVHAIPGFTQRVAGAFLVVPPDFSAADGEDRHPPSFGPYPRDPLPFPSVTIGSRNDPFGSYEHTDDIANAWGSMLIDAGEAGHIHDTSGHGPWPEGTMVFAQFLSRLR